MLDAEREAIKFVRGRARADLNSDRMLLLSLAKEIEIVGEAANQVSKAAREQVPGIPWADIVGVQSADSRLF